MDIKEAIKERHSVRKYKDMPIEEEKKNKLVELIKQANDESGLNIQLICDDPECFDTFLAHYGKFSNVKNYIAIVGKKSLENVEELGGYFGQKIVLEAQMMGLNTCWVGGTYGKGKCKADVESGEKIFCVIAIGYGEEEGVKHKSKPVEKVCDVDKENMPTWFKNGMVAALMAPTALNQQKFHVSLNNDEVTITAKMGPFTKVDLGIVKYNFEAGSGHKVK